MTVARVNLPIAMTAEDFLARGGELKREVEKMLATTGEAVKLAGDDMQKVDELTTLARNLWLQWGWLVTATYRSAKGKIPYDRFSPFQIKTLNPCIRSWLWRDLSRVLTHKREQAKAAKRALGRAVPQYDAWAKSTLGRTPGTVFKFAPTSASRNAPAELGFDVIQDDPRIDESAMSATATICTATIDRQGEIIFPGGGDYTHYTRNPVVLWEHGFDQSISFPIGKCEDPSGQLALSASDDEIEATCFFSQSLREAQQIFALVAERVIRATSIHVIPKSTEQRLMEGTAITIYPEWEMLEWSWGRIGVNPDAVARTLDSGRLAGEAICDSVKRMLQPFVPRRLASSVGATFQRAG